MRITVDELVLVNELLHAVESQILGRAIEIGDRVGAPARWNHASPLKTVTPLVSRSASRRSASGRKKARATWH